MMTIFQIINPLITGIAGKKQVDTPGIIAKFFSSLIGLMLIVATIWAFVQLLQGGLMWISSGGDKNGLENAQHQIFNALVGLLITFSCWVLFMLVLQFLGIGNTSGPGLQFNLPKLIQ